MPARKAAVNVVNGERQVCLPPWVSDRPLELLSILRTTKFETCREQETGLKLKCSPLNGITDNIISAYFNQILLFIHKQGRDSQNFLRSLFGLKSS